MTGFGDAAAPLGGGQCHVELRSLNNRYFKASIRLPEALLPLEPELEAHLRRLIARGSVTLTVKLLIADEAAAHRVNEAALMRYLDHLETIHKKVGLHDHHVNIDLTALLGMPGVLQQADDGESLVESARPLLLGLIEQACARMAAMRATEGRALAQDISAQVRAIRERTDLIAKRAPTVVEEYHVRLRARIDDLLARAELVVDQHDLVREVAIFAERSDISEEITRLRGHLDHLEQTIEADTSEPAGRTLDFLTQEMLREANTIASKSNDAAISRAIVEVKGAIDRIKEQVQNVE